MKENNINHGTANDMENMSNILEKPGRYQAWQYFLVCVPATFVSMLNVNYVFVAGAIDHRCRVSECESIVPVFSPNWWPTSNTESCFKPVINKTLLTLESICTNETFTNAVEKCTDLVYENNDTIVAEFNLGCQPLKVDLVGIIHGVGMIVAMLTSGWMCDRFGRKPTLIICAVGCIVGNFAVLAKSYKLYLFIEFLEGAISFGTYTAGMVLMTENSGQKTRIVAGVLFAYAIYMGEALIACIAMGVHYWKHLLHVICIPPIIFLSYIFILNESPRWQILNGKLRDAKCTLKAIFKLNKFEFDEQEIDKINDADLKKLFNFEESTVKEGTADILKSKEIMKRLISGIVWRFTVTFIYYSLVVNSVLLPGNKYTNFLLSALTSFPGELLSMYLMNKIGRKKTLMGGFIFCGATTIASAFVPVSYKWVKIVLFLFGKLIVSACFTGSVVYSMELFPTSIRGFCISLCTLASCIGNMIAPLTSSLLPMVAAICYACCALISGALLLLTPETKDLPLQDTIEQVDVSSKKENERKKERKTISNPNILQRDGIRNSGFSNDETHV